MADPAVKREALVFGILLLIFQLSVALLLICTGFSFSSHTREHFIEDRLRYGIFRDVSIMIFLGFGFLMTFLRRYGFSAVGYTMIISAFASQFSILVEYLVWDEASYLFHMNQETVLNGLFVSGSVMISFGALLGKTTPLQLLVMAAFEAIFFWLNFKAIMAIKAVDVGGGMAIHTFGALFGLAASWWLKNKALHEHSDESSRYNSELFAMIGTIFLWCLWPSFNAAIAPDTVGIQRAIYNTFLSLSGGVVGFVVLSRLLCEGKIEMVHLQNSTLAGGVAMGVIADLPINPGVAMLCGCAAGMLSVTGYVFITPFLQRCLSIHDTCGVNNLHGMPGIFGAILSIIVLPILHANPNLFVDGMDVLTYDFMVNDSSVGALRQLYAILTTIAIALAGGFMTGFIMKQLRSVYSLKDTEYFNDHIFWHVPEDYQTDDREHSDGKSNDVEIPLERVLSM